MRRGKLPTATLQTGIAGKPQAATPGAMLLMHAIHGAHPSVVLRRPISLSRDIVATLGVTKMTPPGGLKGKTMAAGTAATAG